MYIIKHYRENFDTYESNMNHLFKYPHCVRSSLISIFFESFADLAVRMVQKRPIIASLPFRYTEIHVGKKNKKRISSFEERGLRVAVNVSWSVGAVSDTSLECTRAFLMRSWVGFSLTSTPYICSSETIWTVQIYESEAPFITRLFEMVKVQITCSHKLLKNGH